MSGSVRQRTTNHQGNTPIGVLRFPSYRRTFGHMEGVIVWIVYALLAGAFLFALYWIIRTAVFHALREHTVNSTTAVSVVSANPLPVIVQEEQK
jgi:hypothetical protein